MKRSTHALRLSLVASSMLLLAGGGASADELYTMTNLGLPDGADSVIGVRMNNHGHVAGWSMYYGQGEPSLKGWVWTPEDGFTVLPPPPDFFLGRSRAMDINDAGVVAGDGGYDSGLAWRYDSSKYEVTGGVEGMPGAYLGGINNNGDLAGTAKDSMIVTPDYAWVDVRGAGLTTVTPSGGRATDINNVGQVCGYTQGPGTPFAAYRWDSEAGMQTLGALGLAYSYATAINDGGDVVGYARSGSGQTNRAWIYTDEAGQQELPAPYQNVSAAIQINNLGHVVGSTEVSGPDLMWLWTGGDSVTLLTELFDSVAEYVNVIQVKDINDAGQILVQVYDNNVAEFRMVVLTPPAQSVPGDLDGDGQVGAPDLAMLLGVWGQCPGCAEDITGDGVVDAADLAILLGNWG